MNYAELKERLVALGLTSVVAGLEGQRKSPVLHNEATFEERHGMMVERESRDRECKAMNRRFRRPCFGDPTASLEGLDFKKARGLSKTVVSKL